MLNKFVTNFARTCFHHWTASKAIMEFVQNFLDSDGERDYEISGDTITFGTNSGYFNRNENKETTLDELIKMNNTES